jgi:hypothetical protein
MRTGDESCIVCTSFFQNSSVLGWFYSVSNRATSTGIISATLIFHDFFYVARKFYFLVFNVKFTWYSDIFNWHSMFYWIVGLCTFLLWIQERELLQVVFNSIIIQWDSPLLDLFTTSLNLKLGTFVSPVPDLLTCVVNTVSLSLGRECSPMFSFHSGFLFMFFWRLYKKTAGSFLLHQLGQNNDGFKFAY